MQPNIIERVWRQDKMVNVDVLNGFTFTDEEEAHRFIISGKNVNTPVSISGTITASFKNADGVLVPLTGTIEGGKAVVVLSRECYAVEGPFSLMIFADTVCIYAAIANVINSSGEVIAYPTAAIPDVHELIVEAQEIVHRLDNGYNSYPTLTVGPADVLTVTDGADNIPLKTLSVAMEPKQDLHGYDRPWGGGSGKNLIKAYSNKSFSVSGVTITTLEDGSYLTAGTATETIEQIFQRVQIDATKDYYISGCPAGGSLTTYRLIVRIYHGNAQLGTLSDTGSGLLIASGTQPTADNMRVAIWFASGYAVNNLIFKPMAVVGNTATSFEPWENICPITGYDSVDVVRTGKNLLNVDEIGTVETANGERVGWVFDAPGTYALKNHQLFSGSSAFYVTIKTGSTYGAGKQILLSSSTNAYLYSIGEGQKLIVHGGNNIQTSTLVGYVENALIQLEYGSAATSYEPYTSDTLTIPVSTIAGGTVYGGTVTVNGDGTGTLVVDTEYEDFGDMTWVYNGDGRFKGTPKKAVKGYMTANARTVDFRCSCYEVISDGRPYDATANGIIYYAATLFWAQDNRYTNADQYKEAMAGQTIAYPINAPTTFTLTATQLCTLLGNNAIWCDAGQVSMTYRADTKMYIDRKIAELAASIVNS